MSSKNTHNRQSQKREYRSPTPSKSQERVASKRREHDIEKTKEQKQYQQEFQKDCKEQKGNNPMDELFFKIMEGMVIF